MKFMEAPKSCVLIQDYCHVMHKRFVKHDMQICDSMKQNFEVFVLKAH